MVLKVVKGNCFKEFKKGIFGSLFVYNYILGSIMFFKILLLENIFWYVFKIWKMYM